MIFSNVDNLGRVYTDFYPCRDPGYGPGWYIFGRNPKYEGRLVKRCGQPDVKPRKHPHYNPKVRRGWKTKQECLKAIEEIKNGQMERLLSLLCCPGFGFKVTLVKEATDE